MIKNHYHIYVRNRKHKEIYRCADPDCSHYIRKDLIQGKKARCNECQAEMILTHYNLTCAKPKCDKCSNHKKARKLREMASAPEITSIFDSILASDSSSTAPEKPIEET